MVMRFQSPLVDLYLKHPLIFFSTVLDMAQNDIQFFQKFPQQSFLEQALIP